MILALLQARMSSSRLPGKVLADLEGAPMLQRQLERVGRARRLAALKVVTSQEKGDDPIAALCDRLGVACFRGSLADVLDRFYRATSETGASQVVRLTGDCPLADPDLIDQVVEFHLRGGFDYSSNTLSRTFPKGLDVEVMTADALESAWREGTSAGDREHVTPFLYHHPERFRLGSYVGGVDRSSLRWTVDYPADLELVREIYRRLYPANPGFTTRDVLELVAADPTLASSNL